jgi:hypothetical protein
LRAIRSGWIRRTLRRHWLIHSGQLDGRRPGKGKAGLFAGFLFLLGCAFFLQRFLGFLLFGLFLVHALAHVVLRRLGFSVKNNMSLHRDHVAWEWAGPVAG